MTDVTYLQKQARICREMATEVAPTEAAGLVELAAAYENQVHWIVTGRSAFNFVSAASSEQLLLASDERLRS